MFTNFSFKDPKVYPMLLYSCFAPVFKKERQEYLSAVEEKVKKYVPLMEEKTGINLGEIKVKEERFSVDDVFAKSDSDFLHSLSSKNSMSDLEKFYELFSHELSKIITQPVVELARMCLEEITEMSYFNSSIYVPFGVYSYRPNRLSKLIDGQYFVRDDTVVHEVSHHLWEKIQPSESRYSEKNKEKQPNIFVWSVWSEGFATYCCESYFADLYPEEFCVREHGSYYGKGKRKIEELVKKYGEDIVLEVPKRWQEFDAELKSSKQ